MSTKSSRGVLSAHQKAMYLVAGISIASDDVPGVIYPVRLGKSGVRKINRAVLTAPLRQIAVSLIAGIHVMPHDPARWINPPVHAHLGIREIVGDVLTVPDQKAMHHAGFIPPTSHNITKTIDSVSPRLGETERRIERSELPMFAQQVCVRFAARIEVVSCDRALRTNPIGAGSCSAWKVNRIEK